ncbi:substrate-binding domain-containing protein [Mycobacterium sp. NPDC003449]
MGRHSVPDPEDSPDRPERPEPPHREPDSGRGGPGRPGPGRPRPGDRPGGEANGFDDRPGYDRGPGRGPDPGPPPPRRRHRYLDDDDDTDQSGIAEQASGPYQGRYADEDYDDYAGETYTGAGYDEADRGGGYRGDDRYRDERYRGSGYAEYPDDEYTDEYAGDYADEYADDYATEYEYDDDYVDGDQPTTQLAAVGDDPPPSTPPRGQHSGEWDGGEWTGSHRAAASGRRGVSIGVIVALVTVVAVVGGVVLWKFFGDVLSNRSDAAAARCVDGELGVAVIADPTISSQIETLANKYNETVSPVGDKCVKVRVQSAESDRVVSGFANAWPSELGDRPALWIPSSGIASARLEATAGEKTVSDSRSLVTSPVLLAVRPELKDALGRQNWSKLPELQSSPAAMNGLRLPGWGTLKLALPNRNNGDAAYLAAEAVATESAPSGSPPSSGIGSVNTLVGGAPKLDDGELGTALDALIDAGDAASAPVHAVATTEQQLFQRATSSDDAKESLTGWLPAGPTAVADYPAVLLAGDWLEQEQVAAANEFARYLRKPEQLGELAKAGFRAEGTSPPSSDVTDFGPIGSPVSVEDNSMRVTLANAMSAPASSPAVTIMLDQSMPTEEGGKSRLANVAAALSSRLKALPTTSEVGLWTFDGTEGRSEVATGPLAEPVSGQARSSLLASTLEDQSASGGGAVSFTTLRLVYNEAIANFNADRSNSVLVITTGPHTDQSLSSDGLEAFIRGAFDRERPVAVNVIDFGDDSDRSAWEAVAETTGGTYQNMSSSSSPELTAAITTMLG